MHAQVLQEIQRLKDHKAAELRREVLKGDLQAAQMALGGQLTLEALERSLKWAEETRARIQEAEDKKLKARGERKEARRVERITAATAGGQLELKA